MKNLFTALLVLLSATGFSQTELKLEIEKENDSNQYKLKLERTINGEKVVTEKTYNSIDEIKSDPELKDVDINIFENGDNDFSFYGEDGKEFVVDISKDLKDGDHNFMFFSDDEDENEDVKVWTDENGTTHVSKNGEEIDIDEKFNSIDNVYVFKSSDDDALENEKEIKLWIDEDGEHHVMVNGEEKDYETWKKDNEDDIHLSINSSEADDGKAIKTEVFVNTFSKDSKDGKVKVFVTKSTNVEIHMEDITSEDAKTFSLEDSKDLKLDEFNFYPNPSNGAFRLQFKGKNKPTMVRVTDINGKEIYSEEERDFEGSYDKEIDLAGVKKGIYLLQVQQAGKAVNKKIVIE